MSFESSSILANSYSLAGSFWMLSPWRLYFPVMWFNEWNLNSPKKSHEYYCSIFPICFIARHRPLPVKHQTQFHRSKAKEKPYLSSTWRFAQTNCINKKIYLLEQDGCHPMYAPAATCFANSSFSKLAIDCPSLGDCPWSLARGYHDVSLLVCIITVTEIPLRRLYTAYFINAKICISLKQTWW